MKPRCTEVFVRFFCHLSPPPSYSIFEHVEKTVKFLRYAFEMKLISRGLHALIYHDKDLIGE